VDADFRKAEANMPRGPVIGLNSPAWRRE
jgi:hypothetical protein